MVRMQAQILYSLATQRFSRETLFNMVIFVFMAWFVAFALLYPSHETFHFHALAEDTLKTLPSGLAGAVGMVCLLPTAQRYSCTHAPAERAGAANGLKKEA